MADKPLGAMVARHVDFIGEHFGKRPASDVHDTAKAWPGSQTVFVLASDFAGAATNAIHVVMDEPQLLQGFDGLIDGRITQRLRVFDLRFG